MKINPWTSSLVTLGVISAASVLQAEEAKPEQHQVMTALASTTLSGYVDTSAIWMFGRGNLLYGRSFDQGSNSAAGLNKQDGFNLDVVKLQLSKPLDEGQWSAGYTVGLLFGPDANALNSTSTFGNTSDFAVKEAYVSLRAPVGNGLDIKMGVWSTLLGYEVLESGDNPNFSRSFGFALEPIIHTGIQASYKLCDVASIAAAIADRGDINNINARSGIESKKTYMAQLNLTAPESAGFLKGATASFSVCDGLISNAVRPLNGQSVINYYAGFTMPLPVTGLSLGAAYDYRSSGLYNSSYENSVGGYLVYQATEKLKLANRTEYATGDSGAYGEFFAPGAANNVALLGETFTADYSLWANTITRAELRWDHSMNGQRIYGTGGGTLRNAVSLALNVIYKF